MAGQRNQTRRNHLGIHIYSAVHDDGKGTFEVTCVEGEHFPPTRSGKGTHFELKYGATHAHKHADLKGRQVN